MALGHGIPVECLRTDWLIAIKVAAETRGWQSSQDLGMSLPRRAASVEWSQPKREAVCAAGSNQSIKQMTIMSRAWLSTFLFRKLPTKQT